MVILLIFLSVWVPETLAAILDHLAVNFGEKCLGDLSKVGGQDRLEHSQKSVGTIVYY